jgi:hypothetical protein
MAELTDLERLAPAVDVDVATTQFRRTIGSRRRRRRFVTTSVALLVAASLVGVALAARDDSTPVVAGPGPTAPVPACADIERFAQTMSPNRFISNYSGTSSPAELAARADVVLAGTLTGGLTYDEYPRDGPGVVRLAGYEVAVTAIAKGASLVGPSSTIRVWDHQISPIDPDGVRRTIPVGAPVIVVAFARDEPRGQRVETSVEGYMTGCPGGPPLGAVGTQGTWPTFATFESLRTELGLDRATVASTGFGARTITVRLPTSLAPSFEIEELSSSLTLEDQGWRVDARRSEASPAGPTCDTTPLLRATRQFGGWVVELSGDVTSADPCSRAIAELGRFTLVNGLPSYRGDGTIGLIDSPNWWASLGDAETTLSVFERECSQQRHEGQANGLVVSSARQDDRGSYLTVLCDDEVGVEIWLDTEAPPDAADLARITIERESTATGPVEQSCESIGFSKGEDMASEIRSIELPCSEADQLVRRVRAEHNFYSGPRSFSAGSFACTVTTEDEVLPVGHYRCTSGDATVTWDKT